MAKFDEKVEDLLTKHPHLTKDEAVKIVTEKNARKKTKRAEKQERSRLKYEERKAKSQDQNEG